MRREREFRFLRKLLVLPLLPADHMQPAFDAIVARAPANCTELQQMLQYVRSTWLQHAIWAPVNVSAYGQQVRTNNDVEGWHRRLNARARRGDLPFYVTVRLLQDEAKAVHLQLRLLSAGKLRRYGRKKYTAVNGRLWKLWDEYAAGQRTTSSLLRAASRLQLPATAADV